MCSARCRDKSPSTCLCAACTITYGYIDCRTWSQCAEQSRCKKPSQAAPSSQHMAATRFERIFDVAHNWNALGSEPNIAALKRIFAVAGSQASCIPGPVLAAKYKIPEDNQQYVVSITNRYTMEQTWFNEARTQKPHIFSQVPGTELHDPTNNGTNCDFCNWQNLTATDPGFGRIELPHAVTGSNLFKYAQPSHGIVLFKHHQPLVFQQEALADLLDASWLWFQASHRLNPTATQPFLLWNCLPRAGASQFHGHAQVMLTDVAVPSVTRLQLAASTYKQQHASCYYADLLKAHAALGLLRQINIPALKTSAAASPPASAVTDSQEHVAWGFASIAPYKDMEVCVIGRHICCPAFHKMLHAALRAVIDGLGCRSFNVGALNINLAAPPPAGVGFSRQFWNSSCTNADDSSSSSNSCAGTDDLLHHGKQVDVPGSRATQSSSNVSYTVDSTGFGIPEVLSYHGHPPVVARLVSRGKLSAAGIITSDFGGLEVFGGASIGHTDPYLLMQHLDMQLSQQYDSAPYLN